MAEEISPKVNKISVLAPKGGTKEISPAIHRYQHVARRQVTRWRVQFAVMGPQYVSFYVPDYKAKPTDRIIGHAKVELLRWTDRDMAEREET